MVFGSPLRLATFILVVMIAQVSKLSTSDLQFRFSVYIWAVALRVRFMS